MPNYMESAFAEHEKLYAQAVRNDCWGHLYPKLGSKHQGWVEFTVSAFGDIMIHNFDFEGLESSEPLMQDIMQHLIEPVTEGTSGLGIGLYRWEGWYKKLKNTRCRFQVAPIKKAVFQ